MNPALKQRLAEIGGRLEKATPGPGRWDKRTLGPARANLAGWAPDDLVYLKTVVEKQAQVIALYSCWVCGATASTTINPEVEACSECREIRAALAELKEAEAE